MDFGAYATALADDRRTNPQDDLTTSLVQAEVDGERLTSSEIASFFMLLAIAGNETTRNAISHGVLALTRYPEEREKWWSDFDESHISRRGDRAVGVAGGLHAAHAHRGHRAERCQAGGGRQGVAVVLLGQPRRDEVRQPVDCSTWRATPIPTWGSAAAARTSASARTSPPRDRRGVRGAAPPDTRPRGHRGAGAAVVGVHPRHQAAPGGVDAAEVR